MIARSTPRSCGYAKRSRPIPRIPDSLKRCAGPATCLRPQSPAADRRLSLPLAGVSAPARSLAEQAAQLLVQLLRRVRLAEPRGMLFEQRLRHHGWFGVARGEQHLEVRPALARLLGELDPTHTAGHHDVGEEQIESIAALDDGERSRAVLGLQHGITELLEAPQRDTPHPRVVFDDENRLAVLAAANLTGLAFRSRSRRGFESRQIDADRGAASELAVNLHMAAGLLDEAMDHAEAKAAAGAGAFGGVERLEGAALDFFRHARAGVGHGQHDVLARRDLGMLRGVNRIQLHAPRFDDQPAAL